MPRRADPDLERRILEAARNLWIKGGTKALTMRAVAKAAGTTTPTVYERFRGRQDILCGLIRRIQQEFVEVLQPTSSPEEAAALYLEYALAHAREYELFFAHQYEVLHAGRQGQRLSVDELQPGRELMKRKLAEWLGGSAEDQNRLHLTLWALLHGTAMLLIAKTVRGQDDKELRQSCAAAVRTILKNAAAIRSAV